MSVIVKTRLTQYGAVSYDYVEQHLTDVVEGELVLLNNETDYDFDYNMYHLDAVRNPVPRSGFESIYYETEDEDDWSDSPVNNPSLNDNLRFAYGRGGTRYGNLDDYVGVVMHNRDFSNSGDYVEQNHKFEGEFTYSHLDSQFDCDYIVQNESTPTGEATVQQYDLIVLASPEPFSYRNPVDTDVSIRLSNYIHPLNSGTVSLYLEGVEKQNIETTPFYSGLGGFDAVWTNDNEFDYNTQIEVEWRVFDEDSPANEFVIKYWFKTIPDLVGPRIIEVSPVDNQTGVGVDSCLQISLRDYEQTINIDTLDMYVNNQEVTASGLTVTPLSSLDGFNIRYCPPEDFLYGDEIPVSVYIEDVADPPNYLFHTYSFTTEESNAPKVVYMDPQPCRKLKPTTQDVEVDVVDGGHGLDEDSILFSVDDKTVPNPRKLPIIYRED